MVPVCHSAFSFREEKGLSDSKRENFRRRNFTPPTSSLPPIPHFITLRMFHRDKHLAFPFASHLPGVMEVFDEGYSVGNTLAKRKYQISGITFLAQIS